MISSCPAEGPKQRRVEEMISYSIYAKANQLGHAEGISKQKETRVRIFRGKLLFEAILLLIGM